MVFVLDSAVSSSKLNNYLIEMESQLKRDLSSEHLLTTHFTTIAHVRAPKKTRYILVNDNDQTLRN